MRVYIYSLGALSRYVLYIEYHTYETTNIYIYIDTDYRYLGMVWRLYVYIDIQNMELLLGQTPAQPAQPAIQVPNPPVHASCMQQHVFDLLLCWRNSAFAIGRVILVLVLYISMEHENMYVCTVQLFIYI